MEHFVRNHYKLKPIWADTPSRGCVTSKKSYDFRRNKRLAEGRGRLDEDARGERHSKGEDPANGGRYPEK